MKKLTIFIAFLLFLTACMATPVTEDTTHNGEAEVTEDQWTTFEGEEMGITFDYPAQWELSETEYSDTFFIKGGGIMIKGITREYTHDGPMSNIDGCASRAQDVTVLEQGWEEISEGVFTTNSSSRNGDYSYEMYVATNLSENYPSICFQLGLGSILGELAEEQGVEYWQVDGSEIKGRIANREFSEEIMTKIDTFLELASSIKAY